LFDADELIIDVHFDARRRHERAAQPDGRITHEIRIERVIARHAHPGKLQASAKRPRRGNRVAKDVAVQSAAIVDGERRLPPQKAAVRICESARRQEGATGGYAALERERARACRRAAGAIVHEPARHPVILDVLRAIERNVAHGPAEQSGGDDEPQRQGGFVDVESYLR
jgi:hypothetical protein